VFEALSCSLAAKTGRTVFWGDAVPYYKCKKCGRIHESAKQQWELVGATCTGCFQKDPWIPYEGPVADAILDEEDVQHVILTNKYLALKEAKENSDTAYEDLRDRFTFDDVITLTPPV